MDIKEFTLINVGRFARINVQLAPITNRGIPFPYHPAEERDTNITVFIGNNGAGKTSLLTALATSLSWFVARVRREKGNGTPISESDIKNGMSFAKIVISVLYDYYDRDDLGSKTIDWVLVKTKKGRKSKEQSSLSFATHVADQYRTALTDDTKASLPLIAFYPAERVVLDIPLRIRGKHSFEQLDGYENALNQGVDFRRFFEWFRKREDIENEAILDLLDLENSSKPFAELKEKASDAQLNVVRTAIYTFMPEFSNLRIRRKPRLHISIDKAGETLNVAQLSTR
jgi:predicted ATP-binding protein involved in virulence